MNGQNKTADRRIMGYGQGIHHAGRADTIRWFSYWGADYSIIGLVAIECGGGSPTDALSLIVQQIKPFGFIFISEAWDRAPAADTAKLSKCEAALTLQAVTREVAAMCKIDFARENREIVLWPDTEIQMDDSMPGCEIKGRVIALRELLEVRQ